MNSNERIKFYIDAIAQELLAYITGNTKNYKDGWIPTVTIKEDLGLKFAEYPQNKDKPARGWLFGIVARRLEDLDLIEYDNSGSRSFCKLVKKVKICTE